MGAASPSPARAAARAAEPVRVMQVIGNAIVGGMETWVERLIQRLPAARFRVVALCPYESLYTDRLRALGAEVLVTPMPDDPPWASVQMATMLARHHRIELIHAHLPNAHLLAGLAGRLAGVPVMSTIHGRHLSTLDLEMHRLVGSHLSVVCQESYHHALAAGADPSLLSCDPNGVDTSVFVPRARPAAGQGLRAELGLADDVPLMGFVGRLSPEKGPETFIRAAMLTLARHPTAHAAVFGEGPLEGGVRALVAQFGLAGRVHLMGVRGEIEQVLPQLDVVVSTSHSEAMPLALMEAMACGVPVVATRVGGVPEIVQQGRTGWLCERGHFEEIAVRTAELLRDEPARRAMGERARAWAVQRLDLARHTGRVADLITRLARPPVPAAAMRHASGHPPAANQAAA
ncbi:glycosyltransferase [Ideonella sp.]|uniref:glycosyltransferase n=1 Tax=Ideonella sp. TaxID=1929293 RepID=UPI0035B15DDD